MIAENILSIAKHLPVKEMERLYIMLGNGLHLSIPSKTKNKKLFTDKDAIDYLLKNIFSKVR